MSDMRSGRRSCAAAFPPSAFGPGRLHLRPLPAPITAFSAAQLALPAAPDHMQQQPVRISPKPTIDLTFLHSGLLSETWNGNGMNNMHDSVR